ncbi:hypothetical protein ES705_31699 [subsurface metagenome]
MNFLLKEYKDLLNSIYGEKVIEFLTETFNGKELKLKCFKNNIKDFLDFKRDTSEDCNNCLENNLYKSQKLSNSTIFENKIMEFPCWHTKYPLDFTKDTVKKYMIMGIDPGPKIRSDVHSAYELNLFELDKEQNNIMTEFEKIIKDSNYSIYNEHYNSSKGASLFPYLKDLFLDEYNKLLKELYITDVCKCLYDYEGENKGRQSDVWNNCFQKCGIKEIEIINPELIIFQGSTFESFKKIIKNSKKIEIVLKDEIINNYFDSSLIDMGIRNRKFGYISINGHHIKFIKIYHSSTHNIPTLKRKTSLKAYQELIKNEIDFY